MENIYCRFCAEPKESASLLNLDCDERKCKEIHLKLSILNVMYVDVLSNDCLPRAVCFACYDSLSKAYDFFDKVKKAQDKLKLLPNYFSTGEESKFEFSLEDDRAALDEFFGESHDVPIVKQECSPSKHDFASISEVQVKLEPKEEISEPVVQLSENSENLCIKDILQSALKPTLQQEAKETKYKTKSWKEFSWICFYCKLEFTDVEFLRSHCKIMHKRCTAFFCGDCKTTKNEVYNDFIKHVKKHRKGLRDRCHYCDEIVKPKDLTHFKQHLKNSEACPACGELFSSEESLRQHVIDFVKQKRQRRKAGTPITVEDLTCHICKNIYKNRNSLRDHIKRHNTDNRRNYTCDRCGKTFLSKGTLTTHIMAHDKIRPHVCRICNKSFVFPNMLRRHVEMHSGVKPFSCEICGRCFRLQYQLNAHKIIHTDSMPYSCQYCCKSFRFKQILTNHERQHTGAKPYSCQHCFMEFSNWSNFNKHMKRRHNLDQAKKKITPAGVFPVNPETGQIIQVDVQGMEEWKSKVMIPAKRGKKKRVIKEENVDMAST